MTRAWSRRGPRCAATSATPVRRGCLRTTRAISRGRSERAGGLYDARARPRRGGLRRVGGLRALRRRAGRVDSVDASDRRRDRLGRPRDGPPRDGRLRRRARPPAAHGSDGVAEQSGSSGASPRGRRRAPARTCRGGRATSSQVPTAAAAGNTAGHAYALARRDRGLGVRDGQRRVDRRCGRRGRHQLLGVALVPSAVDRRGRPSGRRHARVRGQSPALGSDGTLYVGSFDGALYALDAGPASSVELRDVGQHLQLAGAAQRRSGWTAEIVFASTNGRSTPSTRRATPVALRHRRGRAVLAGHLAAPADGLGGPSSTSGRRRRPVPLDAATGERRWSFDTALSATRSTIEPQRLTGARGHGDLHRQRGRFAVVRAVRLPAAPRRPAGHDGPGRAVRGGPRGALRRHPGRGDRDGAIPPVGPAAVIPLRLVVRRGGATLDAELDPRRGALRPDARALPRGARGTATTSSSCPRGSGLPVPTWSSASRGGGARRAACPRARRHRGDRPAPHRADRASRHDAAVRARCERTAAAPAQALGAAAAVRRERQPDRLRQLRLARRGDRRQRRDRRVRFARGVGARARARTATGR